MEYGPGLLQGGECFCRFLLEEDALDPAPGPAAAPSSNPAQLQFKE